MPPTEKLIIAIGNISIIFTHNTSLAEMLLWTKQTMGASRSQTTSEMKIHDLPPEPKLGLPAPLALHISGYWSSISPDYILPTGVDNQKSDSITLLNNNSSVSNCKFSITDLSRFEQ